MKTPAREASTALLLLLLGCAGGRDAARRELDRVQAEVSAARQENAELARRVEALSGRVELLSARLAEARAPVPAPAQVAAPPAPPAPIVPRDLAVVRVEPPRPAEPRPVETRILEQRVRARTPPPVPTAVPLAEPEPERLEAIGRDSGRAIAAEADEELRRARARSGDARARALEEFVARYPRHPAADNALVEAAAAHADLGRAPAACALARRATDDYPAGDAMSEALERLAWCEAQGGARDAERRLLERLVAEFPRTPAAARAGTRLATITDQGGDTPPGPARSGP